MANHAPAGSAVLATYCVLLSISLVMIIARFYLRIKIHQARRLLTSDVLMGLAWCAGLATSSFDFVAHAKGALEPHIDWTLANYGAPIEDIEYLTKMLWASFIPFFATLYLCKLSLLAVYFQLFPLFMRKLRIALWITTIYVVCSWIVSFCINMFMCWPVRRLWQISQPELLCSPTVSERVFQIGWALHFTGSIAIFVLPFFVIQKIQMRRAMLVGVYAALSLGAVDIAFSLTRFLIVQTSGSTETRPITSIELWSALDIMVGLIVTCLPSLRPYLRRNFKASSADESLAQRSRTMNTEGISVNRTIITASKPARWREHGQFEELDEDHVDDGERKGRVITIGNDVRIKGRNDTSRDSWQDDKRSNNSDIELIQVKG